VVKNRVRGIGVNCNTMTRSFKHPHTLAGAVVKIMHRWFTNSITGYDTVYSWLCKSNECNQHFSP